MLDDPAMTQVLVFVGTKFGTSRLASWLEREGINATAIHGDKSQQDRTKALEAFKSGAARVLVATDVAARGLDIDDLPHVINYELPRVAEDYVHRIGRTGRAGAAGRAYSLVSADEADYLKGIERLIRQRIPREEVEGFEPLHVVPEGKAPAGKPPVRQRRAANTSPRDDARPPRRRRRRSGRRSGNTGQTARRN